ncbi:hypothetical protein Goarm_004766 [Gossypium armourianum]|uniref:DUF4283 domain-containing protein n=1 Tax=Gossypium armourianum TaxID=34283 RepID=A0A7J9JXT7_9ROSI|nr:hypothetical protein [Gossypium armourianum]
MLVGSMKPSGRDVQRRVDDDLQILEGDVTIGTEDGLPSIRFSERIALYKSMVWTVVVKLFGWKIGIQTLSNRIYRLWKPSTPISIMDLENDYFLVKFQEEVDYVRTLTEGPWIVFGQYLMIQPWSQYFSTSQTYPSNVVAWIRFPRILGFMYRKSVLTNIGEMVVHVIKLDDQTGNAQKGRFVRMVVLLDQGQKDEGTLPSVDCGNSYYANKNVENENFEPWMLDDHRRKRNDHTMRKRDLNDGAVISKSSLGDGLASRLGLREKKGVVYLQAQQKLKEVGPPLSTSKLALLLEDFSVGPINESGPNVGSSSSKDRERNDGGKLQASVVEPLGENPALLKKGKFPMLVEKLELPP